MAQSELYTPLRSTATTGSRAVDRLILAFSLAFIVFMIRPTFLRAELSVYPLMKVEDAFTLLTPLVLIPLYWLLLRQAAGERLNSGIVLVFLALSVLWIDGHGMKLAANSIGRLLDETTGGPAGQLTYFYDEVLGHYIWHVGLMGLSVLLVLAEWHNPVGAPGSLLSLGIAGFIYGFAFFLIVVEGQTAPLGVPFAALFLLLGLARGRKQLNAHPLLTFFLISCLVATLLFAIWGLYWGGLPEFSEVGIIK